jgi:hypothetical protein
MENNFLTIVSITLITCCVFAGCGSDGTSAPPPDIAEPTRTPGKFSFVFLKGISGATVPTDIAANLLKQVTGSTSNDFDLGLIGHTTNYYFLLQNTGGSTISGITISVSNPAFQVTPATIDSLPAGVTVGILPIIRVTAIHGSTVTGIAFAPLMPQGINTTSLNISGQTQDSIGGQITVELTGTLQVFAQVMDIALHDDMQEVDLSAPSSYTIGGMLGGQLLDATPQFRIGDINVSLRNTGNVPLTVVLWYSPHGYDAAVLVPSHTLAVQASETLPDSSARLMGLTLELNSGGVISDRTRLPIARNGRVYLGLIAR